MHHNDLPLGCRGARALSNQPEQRVVTLVLTSFFDVMVAEDRMD